MLKGKAVSETSVAAAAELALSAAKPLSMNSYKIEIAKTLIKRALLGGDECQ
jgi:xanthine dehydrogenase YagS FAD-binding subunit